MSRQVEGVGLGLCCEIVAAAGLWSRVEGGLQFLGD